MEISDKPLAVVEKDGIFMCASCECPLVQWAGCRCECECHGLDLEPDSEWDYFEPDFETEKEVE